MELIIKSDRPLHIGAIVEVQGVEFTTKFFRMQGFYNALYWEYGVEVVDRNDPPSGAFGDK